MSDKNSQIEEELEVNSSIDSENISLQESEEVVVQENDNSEIIKNDHLELLEGDSNLPKAAKKINKHHEAIGFVGKAKEIVKEADEQIEACKLLLAGDLEEYEDAKKSLSSNGMDSCISLIEKINCIDKSIDEEEDVVSFEAKEEVAPMYIKNISSGKFTGFIYAILGGTLTLGGVVAYAMQKLGLSLTFEKILSLDTLKSILGWIGVQIDKPNDLVTGGLLVGGVSLAIMVIIYKVYTSIKANRNLEFATKQLEDAKNYADQKASCKKEMDRVDAHMRDTLTILKTYEVLFNEQKGKLERIVYIEGLKEDCEDYHQKSKEEIAQTNKLLNAIRRFISIPIIKDGKLSQESIAALSVLQKELDEVLKYLY